MKASLCYYNLLGNKIYLVLYMKNKRVEEIKQALRQPSTFPGMYPKSFIAHDGPICHDCIRSNFRAVVCDARMNVGPWNVKVDVLWEGEFYCVDCSKEIETAYGSVDKLEASVD